jgi:hypothetical protein
MSGLLNSTAIVPVSAELGVAALPSLGFAADGARDISAADCDMAKVERGKANAAPREFVGLSRKSSSVPTKPDAMMMKDLCGAPALNDVAQSGFFGVHRD